MGRLSYGELRARLGLSTGRRVSANPSDGTGTVPVIARHDEGVLIARRPYRLGVAGTVEKELTTVWYVVRLIDPERHALASRLS